LLNVRSYGRVLSHHKWHRMARSGQIRPLLLATSPTAVMAAFVKGFGWRPLAMIRLAPRPSSESLQGRNPREVKRGCCLRAMAIWLERWRPPGNWECRSG